MRNPIIEQFLTNWGTPYEFVPNVPVAEIDLQRSRANWARAGHPDLKDVQDIYAEEMRKGVDFPALVSYRLPSGLVLLDGNQRTAAAIAAGRPALDHYVVQVTDEWQRDALTYGMNRLNGQPPEREQQVHQAMELRRKYGKSWREISNVVGISAHTLSSYSSAYDARTTALTLGLPIDPTRLTISAWKALHAIRRLTNVFTQCVLLAVEARLTEREVDELAVNVQNQDTEDKMLDLVRRWRDRPDIKLKLLRNSAAAGPIRARPDPIVGVRRHLSAAMTFLRRRPTASELGLTNAETIREFKGWWAPIERQMREVLTEAETAVVNAGLAAPADLDVAQNPDEPIDLLAGAASTTVQRVDAAGTTQGSRSRRGQRATAGA